MFTFTEATVQIIILSVALYIALTSGLSEGLEHATKSSSHMFALAEPEAPEETFTPPPATPADGTMGGGSCDDPLVAEMIAMHNEYRTNGPLTCNEGGSQECMNWSRQMCQCATPELRMQTFQCA